MILTLHYGASDSKYFKGLWTNDRADGKQIKLPGTKADDL
jgi:hypothetical protein